jgi:hypothetical protein
MNRNLNRNIRWNLAAIAIVSTFAITSVNLLGCLVPLRILLAYRPSYEYQVELENRRHNLQLLNFREQQRAVEAKFSKAMIDCANTPPEDNCAKKAAAEDMRGITAIQKREVDENTLHLNNLDKIATNYAFGKH